MLRFISLATTTAVVLLLAVSGPAHAEVRQGGDAFGVPQSVVAGIQQNPPGSKALKPEQYSFTVKAGEMLHSEVSRQFLNRIVTPYAHPIVRTTSPVKLETVGQSVFVALAATRTEPVALYIMDANDDLNSISLMLDAKDVGPVEITLQQAGATGAGGAIYRLDRAAASKLETGSSHDASLTKILKIVADGKVPPGFSFRAYGSGDAMPQCRQEGLAIVPRQVMEGANMTVYVGAMTDATDKPIEFQESECATEGVTAVASWPGPLVQPGQSTEVYVVVRKGGSPSMRGARPSALAGGAL